MVIEPVNMLNGGPKGVGTRDNTKNIRKFIYEEQKRKTMDGLTKKKDIVV